MIDLGATSDISENSMADLRLRKTYEDAQSDRDNDATNIGLTDGRQYARFVTLIHESSPCSGATTLTTSVRMQTWLTYSNWRVLTPQLETLSTCSKDSKRIS